MPVGQPLGEWRLLPRHRADPPIAGFFGISVDALLGVDAAAEQEKIDGYLRDFQAAISRGEIDDCIAIARAGVAEFPNSYALLNKLMYALFVAGDDTGNIAEWKENMERYDAEIVALGERIIRHCPDQAIRLEATARLAFQHCEMGRRAMGRALYETLPPMKACREANIWWGLEEDEKLPHTRAYLLQSYDQLCGAMWKLAKLLPPTDAQRVWEKMQALDAIIYDGPTPDHDWGNANLPFRMAKTHMQLNQPDAALVCLRRAAEAARAFDERPDEQTHESLLLGQRTERRTDFETADTRPLQHILRDKWLADAVFDPIRGDAAFGEIIAGLN